MQKRKHIQTLFFKALLVTIFGAFFFVQAQPGFMYCAYNNDLSSGNSSNVFSTHHAGVHVSKESLPNDAHSNVKLNKRYQAVTPYTLMPVTVSVPVYYTVLHTRWYSPSSPAHAYFLYCKPLRGPPSV